MNWYCWKRLADSEFAIANEVKSKRIQAATGEFVLEEAPQRKIINNELVEPCNLAAAAIYGLAIPCVEPKGVTKTAEVPETPLSEESTRLAEEVAVVERATIPPPDIATLQKPTKERIGTFNWRSKNRI